MATIFIADYDFGDVKIEREIIERAGHNPQIERPAEVIQIIKRFLAQQTPGCA